MSDIEVIGARTHNLQGVDVRIPKGKLVAFTGISGSGKTSLVIDTVHAEAQLRYLEGLSPFVRQFITPKDRPEVDKIIGLTVTLAVDQRRLNRSERSTVATLTGIDPYLGLLFSRLPEVSGLTSAHFSRSSAEGFCVVCNGSGESAAADPDLVITDPSLPLLEGASPWFAGHFSPEQVAVAGLAQHFGADLSQPWQSLPRDFREAVLNGTGDTAIDLKIESETGGTKWKMERKQALRGVLADVERLYGASAHRSSSKYAVFITATPCPECDGTGYSSYARTVQVGGLTYSDVIRLRVTHALEWIRALPASLTSQQHEIADHLVPELIRKLTTLSWFGLSHLQLNRSAPSMSGGELQRARVAAQLGTDLTGIIFVLDEPSAGLHPSDKVNLGHALRELCRNDNTVLLVEHDPAVIDTADWVVDIGPGAGSDGGRVVAIGTPTEIAAQPASRIGHYLGQPGPRYRRQARTPGQNGVDDGWLVLSDIAVFNVSVDRIRIPLHRLTCVSGVSGSGKSSVLHHALAASLVAALEGTTCPGVGNIEGHAGISWVSVVSQDPIGRTPRSTPATYTKAYDIIRGLFAKADGGRLKAAAFSFNSDAGRCPVCTGYGRKLVDLQFLPDMWVTCEACRGRRFIPEVLQVSYQGLAIDEVLLLTTDEAAEFFRGGPSALRSVLGALQQVGLGYLRLGQPTLELSGGEAQRLRLATAIQRSTTGRGPGLLVLDEPTTGLHPDNVAELLVTFDTLVEAGNTVVIAEHDMHVVACSDWVVDMGPGAGDEGGSLINLGGPREVARGKGPTADYLRGLLT